jgi:hypothetical protein
VHLKGSRGVKPWQWCKAQPWPWQWCKAGYFWIQYISGSDLFWDWIYFGIGSILGRKAGYIADPKPQNQKPAAPPMLSLMSQPIYANADLHAQYPKPTEQKRKAQMLTDLEAEAHFLSWLRMKFPNLAPIVQDFTRKYPGCLMDSICPDEIKRNPRDEEMWGNVKEYTLQWKAAENHKTCVNWSETTMCPTCSLKFSDEACKVLSYCAKMDSFADCDNIMSFLAKFPHHNVSLPAPESCPFIPQTDLYNWMTLHHRYQDYKSDEEAKEQRGIDDDLREGEQIIIDEMTQQIQAEVDREEQLFILTESGKVIEEYKQIIAGYEQIINEMLQ